VESAAVASQALPTGLDADVDILAALRSIPGLTVVREGTTPIPGTRFFVLTYEQPADHQQPEGPRFRQRVTLLHRSTQAPMVLATTGYGIFTGPGQFEPTALLQANQMLVEHRFFGPSTPSPANWEHLTLEQAAADHHRLVTAFKPLYGAKWVSTGGSKGGMASLYHRALYPDDVDATLAYVAPSSQGPEDPRYIQFLSRVGDAACRARLQDLQSELLARREELVPRFALGVAAQGLTVDFMGADKAFEFSVLELPFSFWQYGNPATCSTLPGPGASADELLAALDGTVGFAYLSDAAINYYAPYYFQAGTQLGNYITDERHLRGLLNHPGQYVAAAQVPFSLEPYGFDHGAIPRIKAWVKTKGERILLVYGEFDPWSTNPFEVQERNDSYRFFIPGGNHNGSLFRLPAAERAAALERLSTWMGLRPADSSRVAMKASSLARGGDGVEPLIIDRRKLPPLE
jgi:hypothetical protein